MKVDWSYTPRDWEIGAGFYLGQWIWSYFTAMKTYHPSEFALLLGPWTLTLTFGSHTEVIHMNLDSHPKSGDEK